MVNGKRLMVNGASPRCKEMSSGGFENLSHRIKMPPHRTPSFRQAQRPAFGVIKFQCLKNVAEEGLTHATQGEPVILVAVALRADVAAIEVQVIRIRSTVLR